MKEADFRQAKSFFEKFKKHYEEDLNKAIRTGLVVVSLIQKFEKKRIPSTPEGKQLLSCVYALLAEGYIKLGQEEKGYQGYKNALGVAIGQPPKKNLVHASNTLLANLKTVGIDPEKLVHLPSNIVQLRSGLKNREELGKLVKNFLTYLNETEIYTQLYFDLFELATQSTFDKEESSIIKFFDKTKEMLKKQVDALQEATSKIKLSTFLTIQNLNYEFFQLKDLIFDEQEFIGEYLFYLRLAEIMSRWGYEEAHPYLDAANEMLKKHFNIEYSLASALLSVSFLAKYNTLSQNLLTALIDKATPEENKHVFALVWSYFHEVYKYNGPIPQDDPIGMKLILKAEAQINRSLIKEVSCIEKIRKHNNEKFTLLGFFLLAEANLKAEDNFRASIMYLECKKLAKKLGYPDLANECTQKREKCLKKTPSNS